MKKIKQPKFLDDSVGRVLKDALFPTEENEYQPTVLQSKPLGAIVACLIILKVAVTLFLFVSYPDFAFLSSEIYTRIIELTNQTRIEEGVAKLSVNPNLDKAAQAKAQDMLLHQYFGHDSPDGKKPWQWIDKNSYDYVNAGENLAMNFSSAEVAHLALLKSETHKKNIVNSKYQDIGVAILTGEMNGKKTMVLVEMFGRQRGTGGAVSPLIGGVGGVEAVDDSKNEELRMKNEELSNKETGNWKLETKGEDKPAESVVENTNKEDTKKVAVVKSVEIESPKINIKQNNIKELSSRVDPVAKVKIQKQDNQEEKQSDIAFFGSTLDSPTLEIEVDPSVLAFKSKVVNNLLKYSNYILYAVLSFLALALVLNILIKIRVQHPAVILQSLIAIFVIAFLVVSKFHFAQEFATRVMVG